MPFSIESDWGTDETIRFNSAMTRGIGPFWDGSNYGPGSFIPPMAVNANSMGEASLLGRNIRSSRGEEDRLTGLDGGCHGIITDHSPAR